MDIVRLIDGDQLEQRLLDEAARIMAEDLYGKDRQRMARGLQKAAEICRAAEVIVKSGHWMPTEDPYFMECSECGAIWDGVYYKHCPCCGARMEGAEDEID